MEAMQNKKKPPCQLEPIDLYWFVNIPKNTARGKSLQGIAAFSKKIRDNRKILCHFENDRAYFRMVDDNKDSHFPVSNIRDCGFDYDLWNTYIVQYGMEMLCCKIEVELFKTIFPKGEGRRIKFSDLVGSNEAYLETAEIVHSNNVDNTNSVVSDKSFFQDKFKDHNRSCSGYPQKLKYKASTVWSPARVETGLSVKKPKKNRDETKYVNPRSLNIDIDIKGELHPKCATGKMEPSFAEKSNFETWNETKEKKLTNSDIKEVSNLDSAKVLSLKIPKEDILKLKLFKPLRKHKGTSRKKSKKPCKKTRKRKTHLRRRRQHNKENHKNSFSKKSNTFRYKQELPQPVKDCSLKYQEQLKPLENSGANTSQKRSSAIPEEKPLVQKASKESEAKSSVKNVSLIGVTKSSGMTEEKSSVRKTRKLRKRRARYTKGSESRKIEKVKKKVEGRISDQEIVKRRQKKPFRNKGWSWLWNKGWSWFQNKGWSWKTDDYLKQKYIFTEDSFSQSFFYEKKMDNYSKEIISVLRALTTLPYDERTWKTSAFVYPSRKGKSSKASNRRQGRTHSSQAPEGIPDQFPTQVSDAATGSLDLPSAQLVVTSAGSIFHIYTSNIPAPTTNVTSSIDAERSLVNRMRGQLPESRFSRPQQPARHPQYADQPARLRSFANWPTRTGQDPTRMALYGFFYTGRFDLIRCFNCGIGLKDWEAPDEPLFEHIKHSQDCQFLKELLGQELLNAYRDNLLANQLRQTSITTRQSAGPADTRIRNPQYTDLQARIRSFDKWPATSLQRPQDLADAGLFYTGLNDLCRCYTCDGGLQRWDADDDPWIEHARWFPHCPYVRMIKGQEYINMVQEAAAQAREEEEDPAVVFPPPGQRRGRGPVELGMAEQRLQDTEPLSTPEAQRVVGMGYSRKSVLLAIHEFNGRAHGERNDYTADDLVRILTERQDRGEALPPDSPQDSFSASGGLFAERADPEEENRRLKGILKCLRCEVNDTNILFLPCTHHRLCEDCAEDVFICPVCEMKIDEKIKTFMS